MIEVDLTIVQMPQSFDIPSEGVAVRVKFSSGLDKWALYKTYTDERDCPFNHNWKKDHEPEVAREIWDNLIADGYHKLREGYEG